MRDVCESYSSADVQGTSNTLLKVGFSGLLGGYANSAKGGLASTIAMDVPFLGGRVHPQAIH